MDKPRLDSWKDIARHLGRDVRTVARWERDRGLPVHRVPGGRRSNVFAYPEELDAWLARGGDIGEAQAPPAPAQDSQPPQAYHFARHWRAAAAVAVVALSSAGWVLTHPVSPLGRMAILGNELVALDLSGRTQWTHRLEASELLLPAGRWSHVTDLDKDGRNEVLATVEVTSPGHNQHGGALFSFSGDGRLQWTSTLLDRVTFRGAVYGPPWAAADVSVYDVGGEARIAWIAHHFTWWPGLLVSFDAQGRRLGTFVNSGWIKTAGPSSDGQHLLLTGVTNSRRAYFLAVLDAARPTGRSPEPPGSPTECVSCPLGDPLYYFVFPRTDVGSAQQFPADGPSVQTFANGTIHVQTHESAAPNIATAIYELGPTFTIQAASLSDSFSEWHRQLEQQGVLSHALAECPARGVLDVQRWTPAEGWTSVRVPVR